MAKKLKRPVASMVASGVVIALGFTLAIYALRQDRRSAAELEARWAAAGLEAVRLEGGLFEHGAARVRLQPFELSKSEVTVAQYRRCVDAGACEAPKGADVDYYCNWGQEGREEHPINCVTWHQARAFADWAGARLPTEAEWAFAASRVSHPEAVKSCVGAVLTDLKHGGKGCGAGSSMPVCSKPAQTLDGLCDLVGNVWEWLEDDFDPEALEAPPRGGAAFTNGGEVKLRRGGSWWSPAESFTHAIRGKDKASRARGLVGFRVAR